MKRFLIIPSALFILIHGIAPAEARGRWLRRLKQGTKATSAIAIPSPSLRFDGKPVHVHIPETQSTEPKALVLAFHGLGMNGDKMKETSQLVRESDRKGFVVAFPTAPDRRLFQTIWQSNAQVLGQVEELIRNLQNHTSIDERRIYATGFSNGGMFAYYLGCHSSLIAAIGIVSGVSLFDPIEQSCPNQVPVFHAHGSEDQTVKLEGGVTRFSREPLPPVRDRFQKWIEWNGCKDEPERADVGRTEIYIFRHCHSGSDVSRLMFLLYQGLSHEWPHGPETEPLGLQPNSDLSVNTPMFEFLLSHQKTL